VVELLGVITDKRTRQAMECSPRTCPRAGLTNHLIWIEPMSGIPIDPQPWHEVDQQEIRS
jgi:hypothetical protein